VIEMDDIEIDREGIIDSVVVTVTCPHCAQEFTGRIDIKKLFGIEVDN